MNPIKVYINGLGVIRRSPDTAALPLDFVCEVPPGKLRRTSRYTKMACAAADMALKDSVQNDAFYGKDWASIDKYRIGTIISTGYGAVQYSSDFADTVAQGNASVCSPTIFSGSVPNSCLGQICIINGLKGPSTVLAGGDPLEYAALLLKTDRADWILTGSVEEYFPALYQSITSFDAAKGLDLSEGAALMLLGREKTAHTYCAVSGFASAALGKNPCLHHVDGVEDAIAEVLTAMEPADVIFTAANGSWLDKEEQNAISKVLPDTAQEAPKECFGETLGAGYAMSAAMAAEQIREGKYRSVLVCGIDMIGNYCCMRLEDAGNSETIC